MPLTDPTGRMSRTMPGTSVVGGGRRHGRDVGLSVAVTTTVDDIRPHEYLDVVAAVTARIR